MENNNLKTKTITGLFWNALGNGGSSIISFISNIVLARLLMPSDFGCIAMMYVFMAIAGILVSSGFGTALIQKKNPSEMDYCSVFIWNIVFSIVLYIIIFIFSPAISLYYHTPILSTVLRVHALSIIISSFTIIHYAQLTKELRFKEVSKIKLMAIVGGTSVAIIAALFGFGVWSLVFSNIINCSLSAILLWRKNKWRPHFIFSLKSIKELLGFGGLIALSSLVSSIYSNLQSLLLGRYYTATDLGYYNQAKRLEFVPTDTISMIVNQVSFPAFSKLQDDLQLLKVAMRKNIEAVSFVNIPLYTLLLIIAAPLITLIYGLNWEPSIHYFEILCISGFALPIEELNMSILKSKGKGKAYFFTQLTKRLVSILLIIFGFHWGIEGLLWSVVIANYFNLFLGATMTRTVLNYGFFAQIKDILPYLIISMLVGAVVFFVGRILIINIYIKMVISCILFGTLYLLVSYVLRLSGFSIVKDAFLSILHMRKN